MNKFQAMHTNSSLNRDITPEMAQMIAEEIKTGARMAPTARKYSVSLSAVNRILVEKGIVYYPGIPPETEQRIVEEIQAGKTKKEVTNLLDVSFHSIDKALAKAGIIYRHVLAERMKKNNVIIISEEMVKKVTEEGKSIKEVCREYSLDYNLAYRQFRKTRADYHATSRHGNELPTTASREDLIRELCEITTRLGRMPMASEVKRMTKFYYGDYRVILGKISDAFRYKEYAEHIKRLGIERNPWKVFDPEKRAKLRAEIIERLKQITTEKGQVPSQREMWRDPVTPFTYYSHGTFSSLLAEAGLKARVRNPWQKKTSEEQEQIRLQLIEYLKEKARVQGYAPLRDEMYDDPVHTYSEYYDAFGGFEKAVELAGLRGMQRGRKKQHIKMIMRITKQLRHVEGEVKDSKGQTDEDKQALILINGIILDLEHLEREIKGNSLFN